MKKVIVGNWKSSTFAPAFGENEGSGRGEPKAEEFFESLRPAQASEEDAINRNLVRKTGAVMRREAEPEIQRKTS